MILATTFSEVMLNIGYVLLALVALMFMVVVHELGHYVAGKILGFKILEFSIGFGPKIFKRINKKTGEIFSIRPFPLGGFCQFEGEDEEGNESPTAFNNQAPWKRRIVLFSGAFMNLVSGWLIIVIFFSVYGQVLPQVAEVYDTSKNVGVLEVGDVFLRVDGKQVNVLMPEHATEVFQNLGDSVEVVVLRDGKRVILHDVIFPQYLDEQSGTVLGVMDFKVYRLDDVEKVNFFDYLECFVFTYKNLGLFCSNYVKNAIDTLIGIAFIS